MASFFQKRLRCFYCGENSKQAWKSHVRRWQCDHCQAVNHLDENGEITDPPASEVSTENRFHHYAESVAQSFDPVDTTSMFCSTCQKNQYLFTQTLASYLPEPSHPDYAAYEESYPTYRRSLEGRYPQVCDGCKPRVIERIRQTGYVAKTDHLRRMMERSRGKMSKQNRRMWKWKGLLVSMGAGAFWISIAGQLIWDAVALTATAYSLEHEGMSPSSTVSFATQCMSRSVRDRRVPGECAAVLAPYAGLSLILGALSLWWNPKLRLKVEGHHGRLVGLQEYYRVRIVALMLRFMAWAGLQDPAITGLHPQLKPSIHIFMAIFTLITTCVSISTIKFEKKPLVNWNDNTDKLLTRADDSTSTQPKPLNLQISNTSSQPTFQRFPISSLAPHRLATPEPYVPPTPPLDPPHNDTDEMDWTPSRQPLQIPTKSTSHQAPKVSTSSLFQGHLPQVPKPLSWTLRNPVAERPEKVQQKPNPFRQAPVLQPTLFSLDDEEDKEEDHSKPVRTNAVFAAPKFFPPSLMAETGLENLFDQAFSIADRPGEGAQSGQSGQAAAINQSVSLSRFLRISLLVFCLGLWASIGLIDLPIKSVENAVFGIAFLVAALSLLESLMMPKLAWSLTDILLSLFELVSCIYLAVIRTRPPNDMIDLQNAGFYLVSFMMGHEMFGFSLFVRFRAFDAPKDTAMPQNTQRQSDSPSPPRNKSKSAFGLKQESLFPEAQRPSSQSERQPMNNIIKNRPKFNPTATIIPQSNHSSFSDFGSRMKSTPHPSFSPSTAYAGYTPAARKPSTLSFSPSFDSTLQDSLFSPASTVSDYASSVESEPRSPIAQPKFSNVQRGGPSPSIIKTLNLNDTPTLPTTRYSLRQRRN